MRRLALIPLALLAGCGGGDKTLTDDEWRGRVQTVCTRAADAVAKGGWVDDLNDLYRRVPGAVREAHAAIREIRALPRPKGDNDARLLVDDLTAIEPMIDELVKASRSSDMHALANATREVEAKLQAVQASGERAKVRCLQGDVPYVAIDELRAPVAAEQLARLQNKLVDDFAANPGKDFAKAMRLAIAALHSHENALGSIKAPYWAIDEMGRYRSETRDFRLKLQKILDRARAGRPLPRARAAAITRQATARFDRRDNELWKRMGADSVTPPKSS
jgi:hypothetical protein